MRRSSASSGRGWVLAAMVLTGEDCELVGHWLAVVALRFSRSGSVGPGLRFSGRGSVGPGLRFSGRGIGWSRLHCESGFDKF
jgi:hypothetical protein